MLYEWSNAVRLKTLKASGSDSKLFFSTPTEEVEVFIENNDIGYVVHRCSGLETIINIGERHHIVVGDGNATRDVYHYLKPGGVAPQLRLGITKHRGVGTWSSLPHGFELNLESGFEEVFFYLLKGSKQRAIQIGEGVWCDGTKVQSSWFVRNETFCTIPMGYHPVVGEPGVSVSYIWVYDCKTPRWEKI